MSALTHDKLLEIQNDDGKLKDMGDVVAVARNEGQKVFKTEKHVYVVGLSPSPFKPGRWIAVVSRYPMNVGRSNKAGRKP